MRSKIIWKFFGAFTFLTLIVVFVLNFFVSLRLRESFEGKISEKLQSNAILVGELLREDLKEANSAAIQEEAMLLAKRFGFRVTVIDLDGKVLGETERKPAEMEDHRDRLEVVKAVKDGFGRSTRLSDTLGYNMQYVAVRVDEAGEIFGIVRIALPLSEVQLEIQSIYRVVLVGAIAAVAITLTAAYFVSRGITAPIREMKETADGIAKGNFSRRVKVRGKDELAQLGKSLNMMADELQVQMENLKRMDRVRTDFVANVSHELKTPLTLIKGYVETLEDKVIRDRVKAKKFLAVIREHTDRLGNIINDLLSLSELELSKGCIERSTFDLKATIEEVAMGFERAISDKGHSG
jgi:methyl-accepting chemotaxis protein